MPDVRAGLPPQLLRGALMSSRHRWLGAFFAGSFVIVVACSSSTEEAAPTRPVIPPTATNDADTAPPDANGPDASCIDDATGCFSCEPKELVEFLNACNDGTCVPFDNAARLPLFKAGQALPPVP